jgi:hypothetical protein
LRRISGPEREEWAGDGTGLLFVMFTKYYYDIRSREMRWAKHVARMGDTRVAYKILVREPEDKMRLGRPVRILRTLLLKLSYGNRVLCGMDSSGSGQGLLVGSCVQGNGPSGSIKAGNLLTS